jgi:hypothetical protein
MRAAGITLLGTIAGCLAACSLGALDGFSGGTDGADAGGDSGTSTTDATSTADAPAPGDAGGDAVAKRFCETVTATPRVCVDFDDDLLPLGFTKEEGNGGSAVVGPAQGKDGTGGLVSALTATATGDAHACILVSLPGPRQSLVLETDFRVETFGSSNLEILNLDTASDRELGISMTGSALRIEEDYPADGGEAQRETSTGAIAKNTWQRLRFVMTANGSTASTQLFVDGISVGTHTAAASTMMDTTKFEVGDCAPVGAKGWTVHLDNVVVYETK